MNFKQFHEDLVRKLSGRTNSNSPAPIEDEMAKHEEFERRKAEERRRFEEYAESCDLFKKKFIQDQLKDPKTKVWFEEQKRKYELAQERKKEKAERERLERLRLQELYLKQRQRMARKAAHATETKKKMADAEKVKNRGLEQAIGPKEVQRGVSQEARADETKEFLGKVSTKAQTNDLKQVQDYESTKVQTNESKAQADDSKEEYPNSGLTRFVTKVHTGESTDAKEEEEEEIDVGPSDEDEPRDTQVNEPTGFKEVPVGVIIELD